MTLAAVTAMVPGPSSLAQTPRYRVVDITEIGFLRIFLTKKLTAALNAFFYEVSNEVTSNFCIRQRVSDPRASIFVRH
jgi:hypothetical protein